MPHVAPPPCTPWIYAGCSMLLACRVVTHGLTHEGRAMPHMCMQPPSICPMCRHSQVLVVFNARPEPYVADFPDAAEWYKLHPDLAVLDDPLVHLCCADNDARRLTVAPRMTAVFVQER